jgi:hypothetical protein
MPLSFVLVLLLLLLLLILLLASSSMLPTDNPRIEEPQSSFGFPRGGKTKIGLTGLVLLL